MRVHQTLHADILSLRLAPGQALDEREISKAFKVSRSPAREALLRLAAEGLVRQTDRDLCVAPLSSAERDEFLLLQAALSRAAARLAAAERSPMDVAALGAASADLALVEDDWEASIIALRAFRLRIVSAGANSVFAGWAGALLDREERLSRARLKGPKHHPTIGRSDLRRALVDAIARRDGEAADAASRAECAALAEAFRA
jgi:DNA-binding GntR family transcriptional regulator